MHLAFSYWTFNIRLSDSILIFIFIFNTPIARTVAMPFHPHGNTPQLYTRTRARAREYTFSLLASSIVLNWEASTFKPHGCYPDRVLNDFSFAAHLDRHNYARHVRTAPIARFLADVYVWRTEYSRTYRCVTTTTTTTTTADKTKMSRCLRSPWILVIDVFKFPSWNSPQFERDNLDLLP